MQGERSYLDSFPETINLNQGSDSRTTSMERSSAQDNLLNPVESRSQNSALSAGQGNNDLPNPPAVNNWSVGGWDPGESSSNANSRNQLFGEDLKMDHGWASSQSASLVADTNAVDWRYEPSNFPVYDGNSSGYGHYMHRPLSISGSSSLDSFSANISGGNPNSAGASYQAVGTGVSNNYKPGGSETWHLPAELSGQNGNRFAPSSSPWSLSCKRKAFGSCYGQSGFSANLSTNLQPENMGRHSISSHFDASSSGSSLNLRNGIGIGRDASDGFLPASFAEAAEGSQRHFGFEASTGQQESVTCDLSAPGREIRYPGVASGQHQSRLAVATEPPESARSFTPLMPLSNLSNQSQAVQVSGLGRSRYPCPSNDFLNLRGASSSTPLLFSGEGVALQDEAALRNFQGTREHSGFGSVAEARHFAQEPWVSASANASSYRNIPSSSRTDPSSSLRSPIWMSYQSPAPATHAQRRLPEEPPWGLLPPAEPAVGGQRGHFTAFPYDLSSSVEALMPSGSNMEINHNRSYSRSSWRDVSNNNMTNGRRAFAAGIEGRERLVSEIRNVLDAMRRAENIGPEDLVMFDPFVNGIVEVHDRHRDMRLDVDNMSYEELLALEERMGNVNTGLSEDAIFQLMKQRKVHFVLRDSSSSLEPCCVCQEDYIVGDDIGILDCGHEFHTNCIKQWLVLKNLCPICKMTGLLP